jgi:hypothetical protein
MNTTTKYVALVLATVALLFQLACQTALTTTLELVVSSANAFLNVADPAAAAIAGPYISQVSTFVDSAVKEYASSDSASDRWDKISAEALTLVKPDLPPGTPANIVAALQLVATVINNYLTAVHSTLAIVTATPAGAEAFRASGPKALKLTHSDEKALPKISAANAKLHARLKSLKAQ